MQATAVLASSRHTKGDRPLFEQTRQRAFRTFGQRPRAIADIDAAQVQTPEHSRFMEGLRDALLGWGVDLQRIRSEHFGTASAPHDVSARDRSRTEPAGESPVQVHFKRSGVVARWELGTASLLDLAETQGLAPDSACRVGFCQICSQRLAQGEVAYAPAPTVMPEPGCILPCCTRPISDVVVDL